MRLSDQLEPSGRMQLAAEVVDLITGDAMRKWEWLGLAPFVLAAALIGTGVAVSLGLGFGLGLAGGVAASILDVILHRIRRGDWFYNPRFVLAPALIGEVLGAGLAIVLGFNIGLGLVGGCIVMTVLVLLMTTSLRWHGEGIAWASQVVVFVPIAGVIGAGIAIVLGFDLGHGVIGCGSVVSILGLLLWLGYFRDQSKPAKTGGAKGD